MCKRLWLTITGFVLLIGFISMAFIVKNQGIPVTSIRADDVEGRTINDQFYEITVPLKDIIEQGDRSYVYLITPDNSYWLDGLYTRKSEVHVLATFDSYAAVQFVDSDKEPLPVKLQVVQAPSLSLTDDQHVMISTAAKREQ